MGPTMLEPHRKWVLSWLKRILITAHSCGILSDQFVERFFSRFPRLRGA